MFVAQCLPIRTDFASRFKRVPEIKSGSGLASENQFNVMRQLYSRTVL